MQGDFNGYQKDTGRVRRGDTEFRHRCVAIAHVHKLADELTKVGAVLAAHYLGALTTHITEQSDPALVGELRR
jgi:hypothetical protein